jgi:hypothetical protein
MTDAVRFEWLSVVDAGGQVIHESWHCPCVAGGDEWQWQGAPIPVPLVVLFVHVRWVLESVAGSRVGGVIAPEFRAWRRAH